MRRFSCLGIGFLVLLGLQLGVKTDHRVVAMSAFVGLIAVWLAIWHQVTRHDTEPYWTGTATRKRILVILTLLMAAAVVVSVAMPPATSKDVNSYALYGQMVAKYDASPYTHEPVDFVADPWFRRTSYFWTDSPSVYGPVFTAISAGIMSVADDSLTKARLGFQGLAALSLIASVAIVARRVGRNRAIALVGLNPLLLTFGVNDAHCDVLIGLLVLCGVVCIERKRLVLGGIALALAASVKIAAIPALAGAFVWIAFRSGPMRTRICNALRLAVAGSVTFIACLIAGGGLDVLKPLREATGRHTRFSVWNPVHDAIGHYTSTANADTVVSIAANLAVLTVACVLIAKHRRDTNAVVAIAVALVTYQILGAYVLSWYAAWSIPALALASKSRTMFVAMAHGCWVAIAYFSGYGMLIVSVVAIAWFLTKGRNRVSVEAQ